MNDVLDKQRAFERVTLAVIAGGQGTRMGQPKAWLKIGERPVLLWILDRLQWPGPTMLVTAPAIKLPPGSERFSKHVVDPFDGLGPMRGVLTALENIETEWIVAVAVDMPLIQRSYLDWLLNEIALHPSAFGAMGLIQHKSMNEVEPFPAVYRKNAISLLTNHLESGRRSLKMLCDEADFAALPAPELWPATMWTNLNDAAELLAFETTAVCDCTDELK